MSLCQLCGEPSSLSDFADCPVHDVPLAAGMSPEYRFRFQPWAYLDDECEWRDDDDISAAYSVGGEAIASVSQWSVPTGIPERIAVLEEGSRIHDLYFWTWAVRKALWKDLLQDGVLSARLHHYPDSREGVGPTLWLTASGDVPAGDPYEWVSSDRSMVLVADSWPWSDQLSEFTSLFDCPDLPLEMLAYTDLDHEKFEYSFEVDFSITSGDEEGPLPPWADLTVEEQIGVMNSVMKLQAAGDALWVEDLIACIAFHPSSSTEALTRSRLLDSVTAREAALRNAASDPEVRAVAALKNR